MSYMPVEGVSFVVSAIGFTFGGLVIGWSTVAQYNAFLAWVKRMVGK